MCFYLTAKKSLFDLPNRQKGNYIPVANQKKTFFVLPTAKNQKNRQPNTLKRNYSFHPAAKNNLF
jgi:hypothetical protein